MKKHELEEIIKLLDDSSRGLDNAADRAENSVDAVFRDRTIKQVAEGIRGIAGNLERASRKLLSDMVIAEKHKGAE